MITQTIKSWLNKLFAWWPWKRSFEGNYTRTVANLSKLAASEALWRTTADSQTPQPGTTSVAVEQGIDTSAQEIYRSTAEERADRVTPSYTPTADESLALPPTPSSKPISKATSSPQDKALSPTTEQHLAFLQFLVKQGKINEGFPEGQLPDQYKQKD